MGKQVNTITNSLNVRVKITGHSYQRNNSTIINKSTRKSPISALERATNHQIKTKHKYLQEIKEDEIQGRIRNTYYVLEKLFA